jgi:hypothetical protein
LNVGDQYPGHGRKAKAGITDVIQKKTRRSGFSVYWLHKAARNIWPALARTQAASSSTRVTIMPRSRRR